MKISLFYVGIFTLDCGGSLHLLRYLVSTYVDSFSKWKLFKGIFAPSRPRTNIWMKNDRHGGPIDAILNGTPQQMLQFILHTCWKAIYSFYVIRFSRFSNNLMTMNGKIVAGDKKSPFGCYFLYTLTKLVFDTWGMLCRKACLYPKSSLIDTTSTYYENDVDLNIFSFSLQCNNEKKICLHFWWNCSLTLNWISWLKPW